MYQKLETYAFISSDKTTKKITNRVLFYSFLSDNEEFKCGQGYDKNDSLVASHLLNLRFMSDGEGEGTGFTLLVISYHKGTYFNI